MNRSFLLGVFVGVLLYVAWVHYVKKVPMSATKPGS